MLNNKKWQYSSGCWGGVIASLGMPLTMLGIHLTDASLKALSLELALVCAAGGGVMAFLGRLKADCKIGMPLAEAMEDAAASAEKELSGADIPEPAASKLPCLHADDPSPEGQIGPCPCMVGEKGSEFKTVQPTEGIASTIGAPVATSNASAPTDSTSTAGTSPAQTSGV